MKRVAKPSAEIVVGLSQNHQCLYYIYLCKKVIWPDPRFIFNAFTCTYILKYVSWCMQELDMFVNWWRYDTDLFIFDRKYKCIWNISSICLGYPPSMHDNNCRI